MLDKPLPQDAELEQAVLGILLTDNSAIDRVHSALTGEHFHNPVHKKIYAVVRDIKEKGEVVDFLTVSDRLKTEGELETCGGISYLTQICDIYTTSVALDQHVEKLSEYAIKRKVIIDCSNIVVKAFKDSEEAMDVIQDLSTTAYDATFLKHKETLQHVSIPGKEAYERLERIASGETKDLGFSTGWIDLDNIFRFRPSEYMVLAARPSIGKSALMGNFAENVALKYRIPVGIFSLEMKASSLVGRMLNSVSGVPFWKIKHHKYNAKEWELVNEAYDNISRAPIYIDDFAEVNILDIRAKSRLMVKEYGVKIIFIDYLQIVKEIGRKRWRREREVSFMSEQAKAMARELDVTVVALAQLNRNAENKTPSLHELRESGSLEQDADVVCFIDRDRFPENKDQNHCEGSLLFPKQRNAATGDVPLTWYPDITRFEIGTHISDEDVDAMEDPF